MIEEKALEDFVPETNENDEKYLRETMAFLWDDYFRNHPEMNLQFVMQTVTTNEI